MNAEIISTAIRLIDDDIIEATDALRSSAANVGALQNGAAHTDAAKNRTAYKSTVKPHRRQRWLTLAACFCLVIGAATVFFQGFSLLGASAGEYPGVLINGSYYYNTDFGFYRYAEGEKELLMTTFFKRKAEWYADEYGIYYIKEPFRFGLRSQARSVYVREHETSKSRKLFTADCESCTHITFTRFEDGQIILSLHDLRNPSFDGQHRLEWIDCAGGDVVRWETVSFDDYYAVLSTGNADFEYLIGASTYSKVLTGTTDKYYDIYRDGEVFLSGQECWDFRLNYYGSNLLIQYFRVNSGLHGDGGLENILITPDGETRQIHNGRILAGNDDYLFYIGDYEPDHPRPVPVYGYNVKTGESVYLADVDLYTAIVDDEWFFTTAPWRGSRTDCWRFVYDSNRKLTGLELFEEDI